MELSASAYADASNNTNSCLLLRTLLYFVLVLSSKLSGSAGNMGKLSVASGLWHMGTYFVEAALTSELEWKKSCA